MKSYPYQKLLTGIDCIGLKSVLKLNLKIVAKDLNQLLKQNGSRCIYIEHQLIILNQYNSSIGRIYHNFNSEATFINLYGQSQVSYYKYNYLLPLEYKIIVEYFIQQDLLIKLVKLDLCVDFHYDYNLTLITNAKNESTPTRNLNYLTNFITHEIHIARINNKSLIKKIKNDKTLDFLKLDEEVKKGSRENYKKWTKINNYTNFKRVDETEADYLTLSIKDKNVFWKYKDLLEKNQQNIVFSKFSIEPDDAIIIKNSQVVSIILYNKKENELEDDLNFNKFIGYLKNIKKHYYPNKVHRRLYHYNRVEIRKKFNLEIHNTQNFMDVIKTALLNQIKKTHITIFENAYQIRLFNENKKIKRKKDKHQVKSRNLTIDNIQFNLVMDDLEQALTVPFVANSIHKLKSTITKTNNSSPLVNKNRISKNSKKAKLKEELKEERNNQESNNLLPENLTTDIKAG